MVVSFCVLWGILTGQSGVGFNEEDGASEEMCREAQEHESEELEQRSIYRACWRHPYCQADRAIGSGQVDCAN